MKTILKWSFFSVVLAGCGQPFTVEQSLFSQAGAPSSAGKGEAGEPSSDAGAPSSGGAAQAGAPSSGGEAGVPSSGGAAQAGAPSSGGEAGAPSSAGSGGTPNACLAGWEGSTCDSCSNAPDLPGQTCADVLDCYARTGCGPGCGACEYATTTADTTVTIARQVYDCRCP